MHPQVFWINSRSAGGMLVSGNGMPTPRALLVATLLFTIAVCQKSRACMAIHGLEEGAIYAKA
jgi:hypothetical protein